MKIYADVLFLINFISTYILLDLTARVFKQKPRLKRHLLGAAFGAVSAVISFSAGEYAGLIKVISVCFIPVIVFGFRGFDTMRQIAVFALISIAMSGIFALISSINGSETVIMKRGIMYFNLPVLRFIVIFAISYLIISISVWFIKRKRYAKYHTLIISLNGKTVSVTALVDSGNVLREPITGKDVIIAEWERIKPLFSNIEYRDLKREADKYKLWLVPYHSLGNTGGLIYAFLADDINIVEDKRCIGKTFIGITNDKLSAKNEYNALMGASL